jgi:hypothetical protein
MGISERERLIAIHEDFLGELGAQNISFYSNKLKANLNDEAQFDDLLCEGYSAMMYLSNGFQVTLQDSPDLFIKLDEQKFYCEVKHFRKKLQDYGNEESMHGAIKKGILAKYGRSEISINEIVEIIRDKINQLMDFHPNILLIVNSSSQCIETDNVSGAVKKIEDIITKKEYLGFQKLNGIFFIGDEIGYFENNNAGISLSESVRNSVIRMNNWRVIKYKCQQRFNDKQIP